MPPRPLKIDLHTHILPETWPDLEARYGVPGFLRIEHSGGGCARLMRGAELFREIDARCWSPERRLADCARDAVDVQVLSTVPVMFSYWAKPEHALDLARRLNDHLAEIVAEHPQRFVGLATVPLQDPQLAIAELERAVGVLGLDGVEIGSHVNDWELGQPELFPFFSRAAELGAAIFVHPWEMLGGARLKRYWLAWLVGMPAETAAAACSLVFSGVVERLPALRIALAHGGGSFPATIGRIAHGHAVRPDLCAIDNPRTPSAYLTRFWYDSLVHDPRALRYLIDTVGASRIALGTDYPFPLGESEPGRLIGELAAADELDDSIRDALLGGNALDFLGLDGDRFRS